LGHRYKIIGCLDSKIASLDYITPPSLPVSVGRDVYFMFYFSQERKRYILNMMDHQHHQAEPGRNLRSGLSFFLLPCRPRLQ